MSSGTPRLKHRRRIVDINPVYSPSDLLCLISLRVRGKVYSKVASLESLPLYQTLSVLPDRLLTKRAVETGLSPSFLFFLFTTVFTGDSVTHSTATVRTNQMGRSPWIYGNVNQPRPRTRLVYCHKSQATGL